MTSYYIRNRDRILQYQHAYYLLHRSDRLIKMRKYNRTYYQTHYIRHPRPKLCCYIVNRVFAPKRVKLIKPTFNPELTVEPIIEKPIVKKTPTSLLLEFN